MLITLLLRGPQGKSCREAAASLNTAPGADLRGGEPAYASLNLPLIACQRLRAVLKSVLWSGKNCCRCRLSKIDRPPFQNREEPHPNASVSVPGCLLAATVVK